LARQDLMRLNKSLAKSEVAVCLRKNGKNASSSGA
jgi:hypothetical protein